MVLTTIYLTRHGFRVNWTLNPATGEYYTNVPSPTNIPSDPPLASYGVEQAKQLAEKVVTLDPPVGAIYSSPFYRCLETLKPTVAKLGQSVPVRGDNGLGEWYGVARFDHPSPGSPELLRRFFPTYSATYKSSIVPSTNGETLEELHDRCAYAMLRIISDLDKEEGAPKAVLICTHAASLIAIGRALTGSMPEDVGMEDFKPYTCGLSKFVRRQVPKGNEVQQLQIWKQGMTIPRVDWRGGKGVAGGWDCKLNGDCSHLKDGAERGWHFSGDESFMSPTDGDAFVDDAETGTSGLTGARNERDNGYAGPGEGSKL